MTKNHPPYKLKMMEHYSSTSSGINIQKYWVLYSIIVINVIIWVLLQFPSATNSQNPTIGDVIFFEGAKINSQIQLGEWWRFLTAGFLHIDALHIFSNMYSLYALWILGQRVLKQFTVMTIYLVSIIGGGLLSFLFSTSISIGASGGVFGLFGLAVLIAFKYNQREMLSNLGQVLLINVVIGIIGSKYIDNWAHFGGFITGLILSFLVTLAIKPQLTNPNNIV